MKPEMITKYADIAVQWVMSYAPKVIWAILVAWIWFKIANFVWKMIDKIIEKQKVDKTIWNFASSLLKNILKALVAIAAISIVWVDTWSFVAIFAAVWLAIGMALSWTLWHFASWVMILLFKPYKVWDLIETAWSFWTVTDVQIFNTILTTLDAKTIIIPNGAAIWWTITNFSMEDEKRVDLEVWISYSDNIDDAKKALEEVAKSFDKIDHKKWYTIWVKSLWDNAVILVFRVWTETANYWDVYFWLNEAVKKKFDKVWLNFPYPQRDVHLYNQK